jgi:hypothetical protein
MLLFAFPLKEGKIHRMKLEHKISDALKVMNHTAIGTDLVTWLKVLFKSGFRIQAIFIPKALFITATAFVNIPFQLFERVWFARKISKAQVVKPLFILGHPRSGTTFLQYLVGQDPQFAYCSTFEGLIPHFFLTGGKTLQRAIQFAMPATRPQDNVRVSATLPVEEEFAMASMSETSWVHGLYFPKSLPKVFEEEVVFSTDDSSIREHWKERFLLFLKKLAYKYSGKTLLLKSPANTGRLKEIYELFPDARFIHIHRDPYEVYRSTERLYEKILPVLAFHKIDENVLQDHIFHFYESIYKKYLNDRKSISPSQIMDIPYHELVADPMGTMAKVYSHLSLGDFQKAKPFLEKEIEETKSYQRNSYPSLDKEIVNRINVQWAFAFEAFGYHMAK